MSRHSGPKLTPAEFSLCVFLRTEMYETCPVRISNLKEQIRQCIEAIPNYFLLCAEALLLGRKPECRGATIATLRWQWRSHERRLVQCGWLHLNFHLVYNVYL
jgi:hypothetical protein